MSAKTKSPGTKAPVAGKAPAKAKRASSPAPAKATPEIAAPEIAAPEIATPAIATPAIAAPEVIVAPVAEPAVEVAVIQAEPAPPAPAPLAPAPLTEVEPLQAEPAPVAEVVATAPEPAPAAIEITTTTPTASVKDKPMTTIPTFDFSVFQTAFSDMQTKAKAALEKSTAAFGDYNALAKGNVEAFVEAGKILSAGLQELGTGAVAESRSAFETLTAEVKELAAAKSPTEFLRLQSELAKKHVDHAVAVASKQSEALLKLTTDAVAPVSNRVAVTVEKLQKAA